MIKILKDGDGTVAFNEIHKKDLVSKNINVLWKNIIPDDLPEDISTFQKIDYKLIESLFIEIKNGIYNEIFKIDPESGLITDFSLKANQTPSYIHNVGAEGIDYLVYKHNSKFRKITIPNIILSIAFIFNTIKVYDELFTEIYFTLIEQGALKSFSTSPIVNPIGQFKPFESSYNTFDLSEIMGVIQSDKTRSTLFDYFNLEKMRREGMNKYILKTDIENFYNNIYTHQLSKLQNMKPFSTLDSTIVSGYFDFLDLYNMKINQNQTKGIVTGPLSSSISSELLLISFDTMLMTYLKEHDIGYSRFVDDMFFYSGSKATLENLNLHIQTKLHEIGLETKYEKTVIISGFDSGDYSSLDEVYRNLPFLHHDFDTKQEFNHQLFLSTRDYLIKLLEEGSISIVKTIITKLNQKIDSDVIVLSENLEIVEPLISFILKLSMVHPELIKHLMRLLNEIVIKLHPNIRESIIEELSAKSLIISRTMPDNTLFEIWLNNITNKHLSEPNLLSKWKNLQCIYSSREINPLLLITYITKDFTVINDKIEEYIIENYTKESQSQNIYDSISYSKWWIVIFELHCVSEKYFRKLFISKKNKIQNKKLGVIKSLVSPSTKS